MKLENSLKGDIKDIIFNRHDKEVHNGLSEIQLSKVCKQARHVMKALNIVLSCY